MSPSISVIIPVYNAEEFLEHCLDTLLAQTFKDFEVILVDDGSQDQSPIICDAYARKDPRVRVHHKENGGVSAARQTGLELASGNYIIHVDADDWVASNYLEALYEEAIRSNADITVCDYIEVYPNKQVYKVQKPTSSSADDFVLYLCTKLHGSCCNKLIKASVIRLNEIGFPLGINLKEDKLFNIHVALCSSMVSYANQGLYFYRRSYSERTASSMSSIEASAKSYVYGNRLFNQYLLGRSNSTLEQAQRRFQYPTLAYNLIYANKDTFQYEDALSRLSLSLIPEILSISQISILYRITLILSVVFPRRFLYFIVDVYKWLIRRRK